MLTGYVHFGPQLLVCRPSLIAMLECISFPFVAYRNLEAVVFLRRILSWQAGSPFVVKEPLQARGSREEDLPRDRCRDSKTSTIKCSVGNDTIRVKDYTWPDLP